MGLAEALCRDIEQRPFETVGTMTLSIGLSMWRAGESIAHWVNRADHALYDAKRRGRNQVCMAKDCD